MPAKYKWNLNTVHRTAWGWEKLCVWWKVYTNYISLMNPGKHKKYVGYEWINYGVASFELLYFMISSKL